MFAPRRLCVYPPPLLACAHESRVNRSTIDGSLPLWYHRAEFRAAPAYAYLAGGFHEQ
jgi:hypothetical protein